MEHTLQSAIQRLPRLLLLHLKRFHIEPTISGGMQCRKVRLTTGDTWLGHIPVHSYLHAINRYISVHNRAVPVACGQPHCNALVKVLHVG